MPIEDCFGGHKQIFNFCLLAIEAELPVTSTPWPRSWFLLWGTHTMTWKQSVRKLKQAFKSRVVDDNGPGSLLVGISLAFFRLRLLDSVQVLRLLRRLLRLMLWLMLLLHSILWTGCAIALLVSWHLLVRVQVFLRGSGCVIALFVVMLWEMLEISIPWHECDRRGPKVIAVFLDLCVFCQSLTLDWLTVQALETRRRSLLSLLAKNPPLTALWVIWWVCKIRSECAVGEGLLANKAQILSSLGYNVLNASFLSSSIVQVLRSVALQPENRTCFNWLAHDFLRGFLPTAFIGEVFVMWCLRSAARGEFIRHEAKLYILCLYLGLICSIVAWIISNSIRLQGEGNTRDQVAVRKFERASAEICVVKFVWCCAFTVQTFLWSSEEHRTLGTKYHSFAFVVERACAFLTLSLLKKLAKLFSGLNDLPHWWCAKNVAARSLTAMIRCGWISQIPKWQKASLVEAVSRIHPLAKGGPESPTVCGQWVNGDVGLHCLNHLSDISSIHQILVASSSYSWAMMLDSDRLANAKYLD